MLRIIAILLLSFIIINLFAGLFYFLRNKKDDSHKVIRSLTIRIVSSVLLFVFIMIAVHLSQ